MGAWVGRSRLRWVGEGSIPRHGPLGALPLRSVQCEVHMSLITLFLATAIIFLVADALMLRAVIQPVFARHLGDAL